MPTYTDPVIAPSFTGAVQDKGGEVYDVKAYGAVGDGTTDDTTAVLAAVSAANAVHSSFTESQAVDSGKGAVVYFPPGIYRITSEIHVSSAVTLRGAGMYSTQLRMDTTVPAEGSNPEVLHDGLVWDLGPEASGIYHVGGGLEEIDVVTATSAGHRARDVVVLRGQYNFHITNARIHGAGRYGLRVEDSVHVTALNLVTHSCYAAGVLVGPVEGTGYNTTINFQSCHFQNTTNGPGADVAGYGITFDGCIFESSGSVDAEAGQGVVGRWGTFTLTNPYFENNFNWDMLFGTEDPESAQPTTVTVINPVLTYNYAKDGDTGGFRADRGVVTLIGGDYNSTPHPVSLGGDVDQAFLFANVSAPHTDAVGGFPAVPGLTLYRSSPTARGVLTGAYDIQTGAMSASQVTIGGGTAITKHLSFTSLWTPGAVANGATATVYVSTPGTSYGDTVVVSFDHGGTGLGAGVLLYGSVAGSGNVVGVTLLNVYGSNLTFVQGTLRIDVWKH